MKSYMHANKLGNLEEMDKFLEIYNLPRWNQEETDDLNRLITSNEIEFVILKTKVQYWTASQEKSTKYKEEVIPTYPSQKFQNTEKNGTLPSLLYETTITLIPKSDKDTTKLQSNITNI